METKKRIKTFGKVLYVLTTIARVCLYIASFLLVIFAIIIPIIFSKVDIGKNRVAIVGIPDAKVEIYKDDQKNLNVLFNEKKVNLDKKLDKTETLAVEVVFDMLTDTTKETVVIYLEGSAILGIVTLILTSIALNNFGKFGKNLNDKDEVFAKDNAKYLKNTAKFLLIAYIVSLLAGEALNGALAQEFNYNLNSLSIIEILILYLFSYIFTYGNTLETNKVEVAKSIEAKPKTTRKHQPKKEMK